jgi:hypothetical protein
MKRLVVLFVLLAAAAAHAELSAFLGVAQFRMPENGVYWNDNQSYDKRMTPPVGGLRWDSQEWAVQYTAFGRVEIDAMAVTYDAPHPGGFDGSNSTCVGKCAPSARWKVHSDVHCLAGLRKFVSGNWTYELGANLCEIRTNGHVHYTDLSQLQPDYHYPESVRLSLGPVVGVQYRVGESTQIMAQYMRIEGQGHTATPEAFGCAGQWLIAVRQSF